MFCLALPQASFEVFILFLHQKLREKWQFFWRHWKKNNFLVSANFAYFFCDLHRGQPLTEKSPSNSIWHEIRDLFCLQFEKSVCLLRSFMYTRTELFIVGSSFYRSFKFFGVNGAHTFKSTTRSMLLWILWDFLLLFLEFIMKSFSHYTF